MEQLPQFTYHPDPLATGSVEPSAAECVACGRARGYIYTGPAYCEAELDDAVCPWCIADGTAHEKFDAEFTDAAAVGGFGLWEEVAPEIVAEVARRTPGFTGWQTEKWFTHCGDAGEFLGRAGRTELERKWPGAIPAVKAESEMDGADWEDYWRALDRDGQPTAYVFRCRHCGAFGGYSDCT